jgi:hypothetical protein
MGLADPPEVSLGREIQICAWTKDQPSGPHLAISLHRNDNFFGGAYEDSNGPWGEYFRPTSVGGQPAVVRSVNNEAKGICEVVVGTGPDEGFGINVSGSNEPDTDRCATGLAAALQVVQFLGG